MSERMLKEVGKLPADAKTPAPRWELRMASRPGSHWMAASDRASAAAGAPLDSRRHHRSRFRPAVSPAKARTSSASSSMASGAPARITLA